MIVWIACTVFDLDEPPPQKFGVIGVFSTRELAAAACETTNDFIAPLTVDEVQDGEPQPFSDQEWPPRRPYWKFIRNTGFGRDYWRHFCEDGTRSDTLPEDGRLTCAHCGAAREVEE